MLSRRLSTWLGVGDPGVIVKDVLSGKERILPLVDVRGYPYQNLSACHFAALNFVRVAFKDAQRARGVSSTNMTRWLSSIMNRHALEDTFGPCDQLTGQQAVQLGEMCRVPMFESTLRHVGTRLGPPSMIFFKQSLRQMQLDAYPVSAMVVSRNASATACLKVRGENSKDVFLVLEFSLSPPEGGDTHTKTPSLVLNTSLEQTAARLSGNLPLDNHLVTRDRRWRAQLLTSCTMCTFTPADGVSLSPEAESLAVNESVALLRVLGEIEGRDLEREHGDRNDLPSRSNQGELWGRTAFDADSAATGMSPRRINRFGGPQGEGPSAQGAKPTATPYEQTKRHCRIFFSDDKSSPPSSPAQSHTSSSSRASGGEACFECAICFEDIPEAQGIHLLPCAHGFCRDCLVGHVSSKIEEHKVPVFCPLCMTEQENADPSVVSGNTVRRLGVSEAQYMTWNELEMAHLCVRVHCSRCNRSVFVDKNEYEQMEEISCPFHGCRHTWCKNCQQSLFGKKSKHSCDGKEELDHLVKLMGWKYCPKCKTPVQKNGGCNHMTCVSPGCNTHFCYRCGKQITRAYIPFLVRSAVNAHFKQCTL